jgi:heterokaryon incompatibility protein (HET)
MRLFNAITFEVESFSPDDVPDYAILSHRWSGDEVSFQDIQRGTARNKRGFAKLEKSCSIARAEGLSHIWADTCCIDKSSSAELSEAINSMFRYYQDAKICYAYLHDASGASDFLESDWFNRGWTLQELVAPRKVLFFNNRWDSFGDRTSLSESIGLKTGIAQAYLHGQNLGHASIAERMSWAAGRKTMRPEDIAYCLLGIFDIHMPLLYGEGAERAFVRLQRELLRETTDESWLAWGALPGESRAEPASTNTDSDLLCGMLAKSPAYFWNCRDVVVCYTASKTPISTSSMGIHVDIPEASRLGNQILLLGCRWRHDYQHVIAISVCCRMGRYYRASMDTVVEPEMTWTQAPRGTVKILSVDQYREPENPMDSLYFIENIDSRFRLAEVFPPTAWEPSPIHIRARRTGGEPYLPCRLLRLEYVGEADGNDDEVDYILKLNGAILKQKWHPFYEIGILPKDIQLADAEDMGIDFGQAVRVYGEQGALSIRLEVRVAFMTEVCAVKVYMDMTGVGDGSRTHALFGFPAVQSQVLVMRPQEVERSRQEQRRRDVCRAAEAAHARYEEARRTTILLEQEAWRTRDVVLSRTWLKTAIFFFISTLICGILFFRYGSTIVAACTIVLMSFFNVAAVLFIRGAPEQLLMRQFRRVHAMFQQEQDSYSDSITLQRI